MRVTWRLIREPVRMRFKAVLVVLLTLLAFGASAHATVCDLTCGLPATAPACHAMDMQAHGTSDADGASASSAEAECCHRRALEATQKRPVSAGLCVGMTCLNPASLLLAKPCAPVVRSAMDRSTLAGISPPHTRDLCRDQHLSEVSPPLPASLDPLFVRMRV
jgi:hypothetical protein